MAQDTVDTGITVKKADDFSEWFTQLITKCELADVRYNIKGFPVYREWAVKSMKKMTRAMEDILERKGHEPVLFPAVIPEENFTKEADHVEGFTPEVFWVTETGAGEKLTDRMALRPTSETAFYQMYKYWIRSYKDLPYKRYQAVSVFRSEGKATRPFWRTRELHWIETHCAFESAEDAEKQLESDIATTREFLLEQLAVPFMFFRRPEWDKFAGADHTYAADALLDSGKVSQLPSTHHLGTHFSEAFGVSYTDKDGNEKPPYLTCYGPCFSRIYGVMVAIHGDDKGLVLPFDIAPLQVIITPILFEKTKEQVLTKCNEIQEELTGFSVNIDDNPDTKPGFKFNYWEMKGVPIRIEIGPKDLEKGTVVVFRRDLNTKETVPLTDLKDYVTSIKESFTQNLIEKQKNKFNEHVVTCRTLDEVKRAIEENKIARVNWCSIDSDGEEYAEVIEKEIGAEVRGKRVDISEEPDGPCVVSGKEAYEIVYIARSY
jgi:prolyl-tRNA synthetase